MIYLDNAATTFVKPPSVYRAVSRAMHAASNPGRGSHETAMAAAELVYRCREAAAKLFHMDDPSRVVFTANATHALNIAIQSLAFPGCKTVISGFEHNAVLRPLYAMKAKIQVAGRKLFDPEDTLREFRKQLPGCDLAVCTQVSNVFGYVLPICEIAAACRQVHVPLIVDASQSAGLLDINMPTLGAAFVAMPGHKALFGPQGTGLLLCGEKGKPLLFGGTGSNSMDREMPDELPERLEAGTMNVPGIAGLAAGISYVIGEGTETLLQRERSHMQQMIDRLSMHPRLQLFTDPNGEQSGILSFTVDDMDSESFAAQLGEHGVAVRGGLHCAPVAHQSAGTEKSGTVRISLSPFVDDSQIEQSIKTICEIL